MRIIRFALVRKESCTLFELTPYALYAFLLYWLENEGTRITAVILRRDLAQDKDQPNTKHDF